MKRCRVCNATSRYTVGDLLAMLAGLLFGLVMLAKGLRWIP